MIPAAVEALIAQFARFPGVGRRSAERMAFDLLAGGADRADTLRLAVERLSDVSLCPECGFFAEQGRCLICSQGRQDRHQLLVVERPMDVIAFEKTAGFRGLYHVLGGHLSPLKGITPDKLRLISLYARLDRGDITELILATSPSVEGDATSLYIAGQVEREGLNITRLGRGVPMGGSLEFSDAGTLRLALEGRRGLHGS
ncbi:recombination protein RecR [bacterium]|nr:recombination protein RecR [bacterium]